MKWIALFAFCAVFGSNVALGQTTLNLSEDLVTLGIAATNMVPNQPSLDAGPLFNSGVGYAMAHQMTRVIANPGSYYFLSLQNDVAHVQLGGNPTTPFVSDITIDFQGSSLVFTHPLHYGIVLWGDSNVVLQNLTADYQPLPFTQVRVVSVDIPNLQIQYSAEPGWPDPSTFNSFTSPPGTGSPAAIVHMFRSGRPVLARLWTQLPFMGNRFTVANTTPAVLPDVRPGDVAVIALSSGANAIRIQGSNGCTLRNVTVFSSAGGGVQAADTHDSVMERVYSIAKPGTDRLVSTFGISMFPIDGPNNQMRLLRGIRTLDTNAFIGEFVGTVRSQLTNRSLIVDGSVGPSIIGDGHTTLPNDSPVGFQRPSDGVILSNAIVVSQSSPTRSPPQVTFVFDRDLPANLVGTVMHTTNPDLNGANSVFERSTFQSLSCCTAMDIEGLANTTIRGNYIRGAAFSGLFLVEAMTTGDPPTTPLANLSVANNVIDGSNTKSDFWFLELGAIQTAAITSQYGPMTSSVFSNINVTNNFIADSGRSGVWIGNTAGGSVSGNYILDANVRPDLANAYPNPADALLPLVIDATSTGILTANNAVDNTSGRMFVTDAQYRELAAYAPAATIRLNAYNLGTLASPVVTLTDADGNTAAVTIQNTTVQAIDVQVPPTAALGGAYLTLSSGNTKYFGTLFIDSQDNIPAVNGCTYESSPASGSVPNSAGSASILVITQAGCAYQTVASDPFVTVPGTTTGTAVISVNFTANTGLSRKAAIEIAGQPITLTQVSALLNLSVAPLSGTGLAQKFTALYYDSNGLSDINAAMLSINTSTGLANGCVVEYMRGTNQLLLRNDSGTAWIGPGTPGSAGILQNNRCTLSLQTSSTSAAGNNLTVNYALSFAASFQGAKSIFMSLSNASVSTGLEAKGAWVVGLKKTQGQLTSQ